MNIQLLLTISIVVVAACYAVGSIIHGLRKGTGHCCGGTSSLLRK